MGKISKFEKGNRIYKRLRAAFKGKYKGKIIAIEPDSGGYVIGQNEIDAAIKAKNKFPGKIFDFFRIGYNVVHKFRRR